MSERRRSRTPNKTFGKISSENEENWDLRKLMSVNFSRVLMSRFKHLRVQGGNPWFFKHLVRKVQNNDFKSEKQRQGVAIEENFKHLLKTLANTCQKHSKTNQNWQLRFGYGKCFELIDVFFKTMNYQCSLSWVMVWQCKEVTFKRFQLQKTLKPKLDFFLLILWLIGNYQFLNFELTIFSSVNEWGAAIQDYLQTLEPFEKTYMRWKIHDSWFRKKKIFNLQWFLVISNVFREWTRAIQETQNTSKTIRNMSKNIMRKEKRADCVSLIETYQSSNLWIINSLSFSNERRQSMKLPKFNNDEKTKFKIKKNRQKNKQTK